MESCCNSDPSAKVAGNPTNGVQDYLDRRQPIEPAFPGSGCTNNIFPQPFSAAHLPIHPHNLTPCKRSIPVYPALQLFYLLPGSQLGCPPDLVPVCSPSPYGQPLFVPAFGEAQRTYPRVQDWPTKWCQSNVRIAKEEHTVGSQVKSFKGEFFRPWENATSSAHEMSNSEVNQAGRPTFRPWEEASSTISRRDLEGDWEREITKRIIALDINIGVE